MEMAVNRVANDAAKVTSLVDLFNGVPNRDLIRNLEVSMSAVQIGGRSFPVSHNDRGSATCYINCPSTAYIAYAIDETRNFMSVPLLRSAMIGLIRACAPLVRASGLDHQVQINNWLYSTNPVPLIDSTLAAEMRDRMVAQNPTRAVVIRSLNDIADQASIAALRAAGFIMLPARQLYIFPADGGARRMRNHMKTDRALLRDTPFHLAEDDSFTGADYARAQQLYDMLYLDKYTPLNPQYTARYLAEMHARGILQMRGLRDGDGVLVAVTALFENGRTLTQPIVGYDTGLPLKAGLYRMVMAMAQDHAMAHGLFFNMSAGAGEFKRNRGAVPAIEYSAVYARHLPRRQRAAIRAMQGVLAGIGIPLLRRFEL
tara:strand:+ start:1214 stop:2329 length:1116 start_codon:yes stop_codon:yes gene_type:complete